MPAVEVFYDQNMGIQTLDVSAVTRKFQSSIIVKQDPEKSGIISFLKQIEEESEPLPTRVSRQTVRPTRSGASGTTGRGY